MPGLIVELIKQKIKENWVFLVIIILAFLLDRVSKNYVVNFFLTHGSDSYYFNSFLNFVLFGIREWPLVFLKVIVTRIMHLVF